MSSVGTSAAARQADRRHHRRQSVKSAEKGGRALIRTGTMGQEIKGKKRHILVDTLGSCSTPSFIRPTFKIAMEAFLVMATLFACFGFEDACSRQRLSRTKICESLAKVLPAS